MADDLTARVEALLEEADQHRLRGDWMGQYEAAQAALEAVPCRGELGRLEHNELLQHCVDVVSRSSNAVDLDRRAPRPPEPYDARPTVYRAAAVCAVFAVSCVAVVSGTILVLRAPAVERGPLLGILGVTLISLAAVQGLALWAWARALRGRDAGGLHPRLWLWRRWHMWRAGRPGTTRRTGRVRGLGSGS
ncbi:hypothetical protein ACFVTY_23630 [Streptomyces sp. NPDC058067]|uniref:hypothetical protein n=1 Tax=Streptomyces sp. NPDC058067 TaxID=3346324 RepID=UPI0036E97DA0